MRIILCLVALLPACGCARPEAVRSVARQALPIATQLGTSAPVLEQRMKLQRLGFAERNAAIVRQTSLDLEVAQLRERTWKLGGKADPLRRMALLRDRDEAILADPLAPLAEPPAPAVGDNAVRTGDLKAGIAALDRLTGRHRMNAQDVLILARAVGEELDKIEEEAGASGARPK